MAEILDNEEITAETLNEISTDLGYEELKFSAEEKFGNDKLNAITGDLVSKGILCKDDRCKCTLIDNKITVNTGVIVFDNGSKKRITEAVTLDVLEGGTNYIYAKNDTSNGKIYLTNSLTEPTGDYVPLCTVTDGVLTDERKIANAKVNLNVAKTQTITLNETVNSATSPDEFTKIEIPVDGDDFSYIIVSIYGGGYTVYDLKNGERNGWGFDSNGNKDPRADLGEDNKIIYYYTYPHGLSIDHYIRVRFVSLENGILTLSLEYTVSKDGMYQTGFTNTFTQTLILC